MIRLIFASGLLTFLLTAAAQADLKLKVYTVNYPLAYFAERIGGNLVDVALPAPAGVDPAFWEPDETTIRDYQKADLILLNGADYAKWTRKISLPLLRMVDTSRSFKDEYIAIDSGVTHIHGPDGDHSHSGTALTTWLDLSLATRQAESILKIFLRKLPERQAELAANYQALEGSIEIQEVCGLSIESLRTDLLAERHRLLKQYGYTAMSDPTRKPALNEKKCK
ncbi:MAG: metal ABC transporter substrate-binding protein [Desulfofustis sp.]|nr:metal ABC transporter substrate-binding protein [Desulfofustis sp.]MBT8353179.1 metal ABC transporter substrate-binding protein [Desulfofustis sp.]